MILFEDRESISYHPFTGILIQTNRFKGEFSFPDPDSAKVIGITRFGEEVIGISGIEGIVKRHKQEIW